MKIYLSFISKTLILGFFRRSLVPTASTEKRRVTIFFGPEVVRPGDDPGELSLGPESGKSSLDGGRAGHPSQRSEINSGRRPSNAPPAARLAASESDKGLPESQISRRLGGTIFVTFTATFK